VKKLISEGEELEPAAVSKGVSETVGTISGGECSLLVEKNKDGNISSEIILDENLTAPIERGQKIGIVKFVLNEEVLGEVPILAASDVEKKGIGSIILDFLKNIMYGGNTVE
ncbi:MAG: hypothetical protein ACI4C7_07220, partial [Clostridia bacterium]